MRFPALGIAILSLTLSGCWVLDELDEGSKKMERYSPSKPAAEAEEEALPAHKGPRVGEYFANQKNTRTFTKGQVSGEIVSCKVGGSTQFMKQSECVNRGGVPRG